MVLADCQFGLADRTGLVTGHRLESVADERETPPFAALTGKHRAGRHDQCGDVEACCGHQHPRGDLVAIGQQHQSVESMRFGDRLDHVGDQFARREGIVHPLVPHGDTVADTGNAEKEGVTTTRVDPLLDRPLEFTHPGVPRDQIGERGGNPDKGSLHCLFSNPGPLEQCPMRCPFKSLGYRVTSFASHLRAVSPG